MTNSIVRRFADLHDPRSPHGLRHTLSSLLTISICTVIFGAQDWVGVAEFGRAKQRWFRTFLDAPDQMPCDDTFPRVVERLDPDAFERCIQSWIPLAGVLGGVASLDVKTPRHRFDHAGDNAAIHMVSVWAGEHGLVFGPLAADAKSNEITALPRLPVMLDLKDFTITIDAMGCQKKIALTIADTGGECVLALKDNQIHAAQ